MHPVQLSFGLLEKDDLRSSADISKAKNKANREKTPENEKENIFKEITPQKHIRDFKRIERPLFRNSRDIPQVSPHKIEDLSAHHKDRIIFKPTRPSLQSLIKKKLTLGEVQSSYPNRVLRTEPDDKFDPFDLIEETDEEDSVFLAEYSLL